MKTPRAVSSLCEVIAFLREAGRALRSVYMHGDIYLHKPSNPYNTVTSYNHTSDKDQGAKAQKD